jgi:hypothetical protein
MVGNLHPNFTKLIRKFIESQHHNYGDDYMLYIEDMIKYFDDIDQRDIFSGIFNYIIEEEDEDPLEYMDTHLLGKHFYSDDIIKILRDSGWMEKYFTLNLYKDRVTKEGRTYSVFSDIIWEGDTPHLILDRWDEFQELFHMDDRNLVERVLGEDWAELYSIDRVDFMDEVWGELDEKSLQHIKDYIKNNGFIGEELDFEPDGYDTNILTEEMLEDNDLLGELINDEDMFDELKGELNNFYRWAYEGAAEDELFKDFKDKIESLLGSEGEWDMVKSKKEGGSDRHILKFDVSKIFMEILERFVECEGKIPQEEYSDFLVVLSQTLYCEGDLLQAPDMGYFYPDHTKVSEHLNEQILGNL